VGSEHMGPSAHTPPTLFMSCAASTTTLTCTGLSHSGDVIRGQLWGWLAAARLECSVEEWWMVMDYEAACGIDAIDW
jgi:hypothetical protein